ncbi:sulfatase-like hydrolase/transferase [Natrarchaeobius chitinivorans]|uniref:DUF229 domain-containing protein n=1 Tax=Natrarchaeobius chitinivorans TaxID=1679083 RepID=A0A3N6LNT7_NATCH|nr:sulfatase-like hydrolase/transferase [Natrarchaeobius chitinivorans]RQG89697.1 DUF229 domain-containing protein [Natrarchaeobius chitinivorans]
MTNIVLITIESLRRDYFDKERFPECWEAFETDFAQFTDAYSNGVATPLSFPSIHTGYPVTGDGTLPKESPTVAESFTGHSWAISNNPHLREERGYSRGFDVFTDQLSDGDDNQILHKMKNIGKNIYRKYKIDSGTPDSGVTAKDILTKLNSALNTNNGLFWVHLSDSHYSFTPWKVADKDLDVSYRPDEIRKMNDRFLDESPKKGDIDFLTGMYSELIRYIDRQLVDFFEQLKQSNKYEESMIVIMSDHGEGFGDKGIFKYSEGVFSHQWDADPIDSLISVPLLVKYPNMEYSGEKFAHPVQNGDLLASLTDWFSWNVDVPDFTQPFTDPKSRTILSKSNGSLRVTTETGYVIQNRGDTKVVGDVGDDAFELLNNTTLPSVETLSGDIPGLDEREQEQLEDRLEYLGYK